jgi:hypothetical protein
LSSWVSNPFVNTKEHGIQFNNSAEEISRVPRHAYSSTRHSIIGL